MSRPPWRILIADDDPAAALLFRAALSATEFSAEITDNGADALAMFRREAFDAALLDVEMPGLDGIEVCRAIRQSHGSAFPVFLITGRGDEEFMGLVRSLQAAYLPKPIDWATLPSLLCDALGLARA
jgi:two-component system OmpR family response regulator